MIAYVVSQCAPAIELNQDYGNTSGALKDDLNNRGNIDLDLCRFIYPVNLNYEKIFKLKIQIILRTKLRTLCGGQDTCQRRSEQDFR